MREFPLAENNIDPINFWSNLSYSVTQEVDGHFNLLALQLFARIDQVSLINTNKIFF